MDIKPDNTPLKDVLTEATRSLIAHGSRKAMFELSIFEENDFLLAMPLVTPVIKNHIPLQAESKLNDYFLSTTALHRVQFFVSPNHGLSFDDPFGHPILHTPIEAINKPPTIGLHQRVAGITLKQFHRDNPTNSFKKMAQWPQETFDDFMQLIADAFQRGHCIDTGTTTNVMVQNHDSEQPKLIPIDLLFNVSRFDLERYSSGDVALGFFRAVNDTGDRPNFDLAEKIVIAMGRAGIGIPEEMKENAKGYVKKVFGRIVAEMLWEDIERIPPLEISKKAPKHQDPLQIEPFQLPESSLGGLRTHIARLKEACTSPAVS